MFIASKEGDTRGIPGRFGAGSGCLLDFVGFQAAGADADVPNGALNEGAHTLEIRFKPVLRPVVGVTHPVPELGSFAADFASLGHRKVRSSQQKRAFIAEGSTEVKPLACAHYCLFRLNPVGEIDLGKEDFADDD